MKSWMKKAIKRIKDIRDEPDHLGAMVHDAVTGRSK